MRKSQRRFHGPLGAVLLGLLLLAPAALQVTAAEEEEVSEEVMAARGKITYRVYCSNCHGADGKGEGKLAPLLKVEPTDLTQLAGDGEFPTEEVREAIDGRKDVSGHGFREMPVWGDAFQPVEGDPLDPEKLQTAKKKINELVAYLRTIQETE